MPKSTAMTAINVPEEIRKFAPKKVRRGAPMDQSGDDLINILRNAQQQDDAELAAMTAINVPEEIRKFAPKKVRRGAPMDQSGDDLINILQKNNLSTSNGRRSDQRT